MDSAAIAIGATAAVAVYLFVAAPSGGRPGTTSLPLFTQPATRHGWLAAAGAALAVGSALRSPLVAIVGALLLLVVPRVVRAQIHARRQRLAEAIVADFVDLVAHRCRSGATIAGGIRETAGQFPELDASLEPVLVELATGMSLETSLMDAADRAPLGELRFFFTTCAVLLVTGGSAAETLERLADRMRLSASSLAEAQAQSGQQLASASVMAFLPIGFAALFAFTDPQAKDLYAHSAFGAVCLGASLGLSGLGWLWMQHILGGRGS